LAIRADQGQAELSFHGVDGHARAALRRRVRLVRGVCVRSSVILVAPKVALVASRNLFRG
jgi:hypothetical protein